MATVAENLATRRANVAQLLADLVAGAGLDGPNHTGEAAVQRQQKIEGYLREIKMIDEIIGPAESPAEVHTYGIV